MPLRIFLALVAAAAVAVGFALPGPEAPIADAQAVSQLQTIDINP